MTDVLIAGGGVTGLSAALFLARQGIRATLVERHPGTAMLPQARAFNPRTMEIYRAYGLEPDIRARASILADLPEMIGAATLAGEERFRVDLGARLRPAETVSPTDWGMVDQDELEQVLRAHAEEAGADVRFGTELVSYAQADGRAVVRDARDEYEIEASYLIAADGHRAGIRRGLGIGVDQVGETSHGVYFVFDADLTPVLRDRRFLLAYLDEPTVGTVLVPLRQAGRWMMGMPCPQAHDYTEQDCVELARAAIGVPDLDVRLVPPVPGWPHKISHSTSGAWVAQRYRAGRVFFAGDAAHVVPPAGSYGASTGIADAHNLAWKLAAVVKGEAGDALLDTYEDERRPVAQSTLETSLRLLHDRHHADGDEATRAEDLMLTLGYCYDSAAVLGAPPSALVEDPRTPSARPGSRAPHTWLTRDGIRLSTIDLFTGDFVLLAGPDATPWTTGARALGLTAHQLDVDFTAPDFLKTYDLTPTTATLIRPDGFIAWRTPPVSPDPEQDLRSALQSILSW
ncbi:FAD-dependent oxidoreductase [Actinokineospora auranticolor]|uniref:Putative polyketide hydroxylase n=1 Tax=Actinokineospora auranticolor TaxID=155976 RepID=A0A2S6GGX7_9PSEU|nr:FAD-dependent oxidoreductase [Actinokineospora auranticolor]PPK64450.1 putative polyketide hydroxylase [Actinokineospora auranticolor]